MNTHDKRIKNNHPNGILIKMMQDLSPQQDIEMKSSLIAVSSCHTSRISLQKECNQEMGGRKGKAEWGQGEGEPCAYPNYSSTVLT